MVKCEICKNNYKSINGLSYHISQTHNMTSQDYYNKYIKQENEGICVVCGKSTVYLGLGKGYRLHCSKSCTQHDSAVRRKTETTLLNKYNVRNPLNRPEAQEKAKQTNIKKFGTDCPLKSSIVRDKIKKTLNERYNVENPWQLEKVIKNSKSKEAKKKAIETKQKNNSFNKSKLEDTVYNNLINIFGKNNIKRNQDTDFYPYACDFYIPNINLYIECNFHWTHGGHWYNYNIDQDKLNTWIEKSKDNKYYQSAIHIWTNSDVKKRLIAKKNKLNYVVFWKYEDFLLWQSLNIPIGHDYDKEYSWIPNR